MRSLLIVAIGSCASAFASLSVWAVLTASESATVWCEVVNERLVRTNARDGVINDAVEAVLANDRLRRPIAGGPLEECLYEQTFDVWFSERDALGYQNERLRRLVRQQLDGRGRLLRITQLHGEDMPTLLFIEQGDSLDGDSDTAERIARALADRSVAVR